MNYGGYKEAVDDEQLIVQIESGIQASSGDWLNSSDLSRERLKSTCLLYTSPSPRDGLLSRMPSSA